MGKRRQAKKTARVTGRREEIPHGEAMGKKLEIKATG